MKKILVCMMAVLLLALCGCQKAQPAAPTQPAPTTIPAPTASEPTTPSAPTDPEPTTAPAGQTVTSYGKLVDGLVCIVTIDGQEPKTVENPVSSDLYYYLLSCRKDAVEETLPANNEVAGIEFSFQVDGRQSHRYWVYADGYVAIPVSTGGSSYRYFKFPDNCYSNLMATIG